MIGRPVIPPHLATQAGSFRAQVVPTACARFFAVIMAARPSAFPARRTAHWATSAAAVTRMAGQRRIEIAITNKIANPTRCPSAEATFPIA
jgi:hypothetical protein